MQKPNKSPTNKQLSREAKFINTVWCTPIIAVLITLLLMVTWIPDSAKTIAITLLILIHIIQYFFTLRQVRSEKKVKQPLKKRNERGA